MATSTTPIEYGRDFARALADFLIRGVDAGNIDRTDAFRGALSLDGLDEATIERITKSEVVMALLHTVWE